MADSCPAPAPRQEESRFRRIAREYFESPLATIALVVFCIILLARPVRSLDLAPESL